MKIEGYLFVPYQGQVRFRYDDSTDLVFHKSDGAYDKVLGVHALAGSRPGTCTELVSRVKSVQDAHKQLMGLAFQWLVPLFRKSDVGTVTKLDLGDGPVQLRKDTRAKVTLTVVLVDK